MKVNLLRKGHFRLKRTIYQLRSCVAHSWLSVCLADAEPWVQTPVPHKTRHAGNACNASTQEGQKFKDIPSSTVSSRLA